MNRFVAVCLALTGAAASASAATLVGNPVAARDKVAACIGCHGIADYRAAYPEVYRVPMLGGQNAQYIDNALHAYKNGERKFQTMRAVVMPLSDQDIADIAAYYATQTVSSQNDPEK